MDFINYHQTQNATSLQLPNKERNRVAGNSHIYERALKKNKIASHSKKKEGVIEKNGIANYSEKKEIIKDANENMSKINFLNQGIIKCNWQNKKKVRL